MKTIIKRLVILCILIACKTAKPGYQASQIEKEQYRPAVHFTPDSGWMNDPNGLVYFNNKYHLFYQHYPDSNVWGPMYWGHATSTDLVHWNHQPVALYPDSNGYIFSGSVVADVNNTSGLGKNRKTPLVAIYTSHNTRIEKTGRNDFQTQSFAYSNDEGKTWLKYYNNPVLKNPGIRDFRDPKVCWFEAGKKWIMTLATQDCVTFYSSPDLKNWTRESDFGKSIGAHGGVWECPDLFRLNLNGIQYWVLLVSINPGGPNGGSGTQYFIGDFDGKTFKPFDKKTRWIDYGPDDYAGITWSNTGDRKIFIGWMSNWTYANQVPTVRWRGATTMPRELSLQKVDNEYFVTSMPVAELEVLSGDNVSLNNISANNFDLTSKIVLPTGAYRIEIKTKRLEDFSLNFTNQKGEQLLVGYDKVSNNYFIDRTNSGNVSFNKAFAAKLTAPRITANTNADITLIIDEASVELFADNGLSVMTAVFFQDNNFDKINIQSNTGMMIDSLDFIKLKTAF